jgi:hypothetical protein
MSSCFSTTCSKDYIFSHYMTFPLFFSSLFLFPLLFWFWFWFF